MSADFEPIRFSRAAFIKHFSPCIREDGEPGDWYVTFQGQALTWAKLQEVAELGYPRGPWMLTLEEVFKNYHQSIRVSGR